MTDSTTQFDYEEDHAEKAIDRLPSRFRDKKRLEGLVGGFADATQALEDIAFDVLVSTGLNQAVGEALDQWGKLVGLDRQGLGDASFRRFIKAQIQINQSQGTTDDLIEIWQTLTADSTVRHRDHFPHGFRLTAFRSSFMSDRRARRVKRIMNTAKPAGVAMSLVEAISNPDTAGGYSIARAL